MSQAKFDVVAYTYDWHPPNHISFYENRHLRPTAPESPVSLFEKRISERDCWSFLGSSFQVSNENAKLLDRVIFLDPKNSSKRIEQVLWPAHCVQKTEGAELHRDLDRVDNSIHVYKGTNPEIDSYSAFWDNMKLSKTTLDDQLKARSVTDVYLVGLATDVCVGTLIDRVKGQVLFECFLSSKLQPHCTP